MSATRVVVIGSGIAGAATAFGLARRGISVFVVDAGVEGRATDAGAGILQPWSSRRDGEFYRRYADGAEYYPSFLSALEGYGVTDVGYRRVGALVTSAVATELDEVEALLASRRENSPAMGEVRRLARGQSVAFFPPIDPPLFSVLIEGGARVDGRQLASGMLDAARAAGAVVVTDTAVLEAAGDGFRTLLGDGEALEADGVVVAAGAWTPALLAPLGLTVPVEPQKGQIVHLRVRGDTSNWPIVLPLGSTHYLLAFDDARVVAGATREFGSGFDTRVTPPGMQELLHNAPAVAPGLADSAIIETRVGLRPLPLSADQLPTVGRLEIGGSLPLWVNAGFGAAGLTMAPLAGEQLAAEIVDTI